VAGFVAALATSVLIAFSGALFGIQPGISFVWIMPASLAVGFAVAFALPGTAVPTAPEPAPVMKR
jgi:hypothetical protein